jgi:hypothetical protein
LPAAVVARVQILQMLHHRRGRTPADIKALPVCTAEQDRGTTEHLEGVPGRQLRTARSPTFDIYQPVTSTVSSRHRRRGCLVWGVKDRR